MNDGFNRQLIRNHEGCRMRVYRDTAGKATIGYGFNLDAPNARVTCATVGVDFDALLKGRSELTPTQADLIFNLQYMRVRGQARITFPEIDAMPDEAAAVICDMIFNLGYAGFLQFRRFIEAMKAERWAAAIQEMENSAWSLEVPHRVADDVKLMEQIGADPILKG